MCVMISSIYRMGRGSREPLILDPAAIAFAISLWIVNHTNRGGCLSCAATTDRSNTWSISWSCFSVTSTVPQSASPSFFLSLSLSLSLSLYIYIYIYIYISLSFSFCLSLSLFSLCEFIVPLCPTRSNMSTTFTFNRRIPRGDSIIYTLESEFNLHDQRIRGTIGLALFNKKLVLFLL